MFMLVIGGAASGKSAFAEACSAARGAPALYVATMEPFGEEAAARIERHHRAHEALCVARHARELTYGAGDELLVHTVPQWFEKPNGRREGLSPRFASVQPLVKKGETNDSWRRPIIHSARLIVHRASW